MRTIVERMLPADFLLDLGVYMQTSAHIELAVWQTTMHAEGIDVHSVEAHRQFVEIKLSTTTLLNRFRASASFCPGWIADRIQVLADQVKDGLETRNLAAHGAFYWEGEGQIGAAHYFARGPRSARDYFEMQQTATRQVVEETIQVANQLLHEVIALRSMVYAWRFPDGLPWDDPLQVADDQSNADQTSSANRLTD